MRRWLWLVGCRLRRHAPALHLADGRIWLRCELCGYETPGWTWLIAARASTSAKVARFRKRIAA